MPRSFKIFLLFVSICPTVVRAQDAGARSFGGSYERLRPEQQRLILNWLAEYQKISGQKMDPSSYDKLPLSNRTTFDAVTHALLTTKLTDKNGVSMGTALDLVQLVEAVHGQIPQARGDHQFRLYVKLKPDGVDRLYRCREFERTRDNSIYHIGYPINFRQQGGAPSIQFSVTRTGMRADIDVDYRSSSGPQALMNGHLTAANSDVRAGGNPVKHAERWSGFENWWRDLLGLFTPAPKEEIALGMDVNVPEKPRVTDSARVEEAVHDFFQSWLVEGKPQVAMSYVSVKSYACLAEFQTGEGIDSGLAALRILGHMRRALVAYGKSDSLQDVIQGAPLYAPGARVVKHEYGGLFSLEQLQDDAAQQMDCRIRLKLNLAEALPKVSHAFGDYYGSITRMKKETGQVVYLSQVWTNEEGHWKIVSFHLENPFRTEESPTLSAKAVEPVKRAAQTPVDAGLVKTTESFMRQWLVERRYDEAAALFAPEAGPCKEVQSAGSPRAFLASVGALLPKGGDLSELIATVEHGHRDLEVVPHPSEKTFLLARVSDDLAAMSACDRKATLRAAGAGKAVFSKGNYQTIFRLKNSSGVAGSVLLQWAARNGQWKIVAADIITE